MADAKAAVAGAQDFANTITAQKDNITAIVADATELADKLNAASTRIDSVLGKAEELLADEDGAGKNFFQEAAGAAKALRQTAETFNCPRRRDHRRPRRFLRRAGSPTSPRWSPNSGPRWRGSTARSPISRENPGGAVFGGNSGVREYNRR